MGAARLEVRSAREEGPMADRILFTIGYEGREQSELIRILQENRVSLLLDVRARASSRKRGFSKTSLAEACAAVGIAYTHDRDLGTPRELMAHVRTGAGYDLGTTDAYRTHLLSLPGAVLGDAVEQSIKSTACLLCYERDARDCHRKVVADEVAKRAGVTVKHL